MCPFSLSWPLKSSHDTERNTKAPAPDLGGPRFAALTFAHRARCASAIFDLVAALFSRCPGLPTLRPLVSLASIDLAACSRRILATISSMILSMGGIKNCGGCGGGGPDAEKPHPHDRRVGFLNGARVINSRAVLQLNEAHD
jgi:hypothetical protein